LNVLFIEDDLIDQKAIERMVAKNEIIHDHTICDSVSSALVKLKQNQYDVIVTDYKLQDGSGIDIVAEVEAKPVIVVTGLGDEALAVSALKAGAIDYIVKDQYNGHLEVLPLAIQKAHDQYIKNVRYKEAQERYKDLFENSTDLIQSVDPTGKFIYVNPSWLDTLGYTREEARNLTFMNIVHPDFQNHFKNIFKGLISGKIYKNEEVQFVSKTGKIIKVAGNLNCKFDEFNNPIITRGIFRDITEKRKAQAKLKSSEDRYKLLVESANDIIYYADENGWLKFINKHGPTFTGYSQEELLGIHFTKLIDKEYVDDVVNFYMKQFHEKIDSTYLELTGKNSGWVKVCASYMTNQIPKL